MSASVTCPKCHGSAIWETGNNDVTCPCVKSASFDALHAVYHERDFKVHTNDSTVEFVCAVLAASVRRQSWGCPACAAGYPLMAHDDILRTA